MLGTRMTDVAYEQACVSSCRGGLGDSTGAGPRTLSFQRELVLVLSTVQRRVGEAHA